MAPTVRGSGAGRTGAPLALRLAILLIGLICTLPILAVGLASVWAPSDTVGHLASTVLPRYAGNTVGLVAVVGLASAAIGVSTAWLVTMAQFPGRRMFEIALVLPFAFPAYVLAFAYTHVLDHPGIVQTTLRSITGWGPRDYWFPEIRSFGGAATMMTFVLYPYVYLLARAAFRTQSAAQFIAARSLGKGNWFVFMTISLPMARAAIAGGMLLVAMETIADFGTVAYFSVQTFATGIYQSWFAMADRAAAAQLALCLLSFALLLAGLERLSRRGQSVGGSKTMVAQPVFHLTGWRAVGAVTVCALPVLIGAVIPTIALSFMAFGSEQDLLSPRYVRFIQNSVTLSSVAAGLTVVAALVIGTGTRLYPTTANKTAGHIARLGYAVPGGVIAVGLLVPFAALDNAIDAVMESWFDINTGLLLTGSIWVLVLAYMTRFMAAALGAYEGGIANINPNLDSASRVLGRNTFSTVARVHVPLLSPSLLTAALIVFVDVMKELPATMIMRPFNYDTLAVQAYRLASDERLEGAAVPSLVIAAIGLVPTILLCMKVAQGRR
ncbi:MAG: iron ABC transporter permease [Pseudomonadota bacterium]